jgi:hypothetical protein
VAKLVPAYGGDHKGRPYSGPVVGATLVVAPDGRPGLRIAPLQTMPSADASTPSDWLTRATSDGAYPQNATEVHDAELGNLGCGNRYVADLSGPPEVSVALAREGCAEMPRRRCLRAGGGGGAVESNAMGRV